MLVHFLRRGRSFSGVQNAILKSKEPEKGKVFCTRELPPNAVKLGNHKTDDSRLREKWARIVDLSRKTGMKNFFMAGGFCGLGLSDSYAAAFGIMILITVMELWCVHACPVVISAIYYCEDSSNIILEGPNYGFKLWGRTFINIPPDFVDFEILTNITGPSKIPKATRDFNFQFQFQQGIWRLVSVDLVYPNVYPVLDGLELGSIYGKLGPRSLIFLESVSGFEICGSNSDPREEQSIAEFIHLPSVKREVDSCQKKSKVFRKSSFGLALMGKIQL